ncbi:hypothetical protein AA0498_2880 [Acidomonas methanolica]|uniref:Transposase n=1 Tax=Acidomonas methanolica NBRC 104435 TaxID=1231351 RepID=A0A023D403_ACIMT|nr:transposase [Acidomonas methanolica NBRC 104435]GBQ60954.1 hypothetical protein AA0498_2880 [Acidomonas methanolica]GEL00794.1 hypothetical protein AME01nite_32920 [Acidomonas methanolica NBRC 104435]
MDACGTSHDWARAIAAFGHTVKMMSPIYVKPYVKRGKTDAVDAKAICEAVTRPTMRFVGPWRKLGDGVLRGWRIVAGAEPA